MSRSAERSSSFLISRNAVAVALAALTAALGEVAFTVIWITRSVSEVAVMLAENRPTAVTDKGSPRLRIAAAATVRLSTKATSVRIWSVGGWSRLCVSSTEVVAL